MENFNLNESNAHSVAEVLNALEGLKKPVLAFLGFLAFLHTLTILDEDSGNNNPNNAYVDIEATEVDS